MGKINRREFEITERANRNPVVWKTDGRVEKNGRCHKSKKMCERRVK